MNSLSFCQFIVNLVYFNYVSEAQKLISTGFGYQNQKEGVSCTSEFDAPGYCMNFKECDFLMKCIYNFTCMSRMALGNSPCHPNGDLVCCPQFKGVKNVHGSINTHMEEPVSVPLAHPWYVDKRTDLLKQKTTTQSWYEKGVKKLFQSTTSHPLNELVDVRNKPNGSTQTLSYPPQKRSQCGYNRRSSYNKIVGGATSTLGAWPWIANLGYKSRSSNKLHFLCAGSLISNRHVLTAAHCVHEQDNLVMVRLGEYDLSSDNDGAQPINVAIEKKKVHPRYAPVTKENDIAILRLSHGIKFTDDIHPICLPAAGTFKSHEIEGTSPFVAGWGSSHFQGPPSSVLREVQVTIVDTKRCADSYRSILQVTIDDRVICAGDTFGRRDSCQGDSGGPLMLALNSTFYLIGLVSNGYKCAEPAYPGIYTRITSMLDFIESYME